MTKDELSRVLALVGMYWPHSTRAWTADAFEAWEGLLIDLDVGYLVAAVQQAASDGREYAPTPGQMRMMALELQWPMPTAEQAWAEVRAQVAAVGSSRGTAVWSAGHDIVREPTWSHPLIGQVADALGWDELCRSERQMADRAHYLRMWAEAVGRERSKTHMPPAARAILAGRNLALPDKRLKALAQ